MNPTPSASFFGLVDLAAADFGGRALGCSDDFFAGMENMLQPGRGVFIEGKFTERGKWMDGWESRRKRVPGHDSCAIELGALGEVAAFDVDTHHFVGNHPPFAAVEGLCAPRGASYAELEAMTWHELLPQSPLRPDSQNFFLARRSGAEPVSHVRLHIFPDGGVARFRVYGRVLPWWSIAGASADPTERDAETRAQVAPEWVDLAALKNGALALACSDAFFGPMNNLLLPGRAENMGGGWETRRKRQPGHDWILVKLATRGTPRFIEVDTNHFKGNYPDRCSIELVDCAAGTPRITELIRSADFRELLPESKLQASTRNFFALPAGAPATHLRLNIFPDGGVSRLRVWGTRDG
ncbi:MAG: allantoicase [Myxococcales bacterium]